MKRFYFLLFLAGIVSVANQSEACTRVVYKGPLSVKWTSRYGSVIASAWDIATADGMNEKGLVANVFLPSLKSNLH